MSEPNTPPTGESHFLDNVLVIGAVLIIAGVMAGLFLDHVPQENLPIISGLAGTLMGTVIGGYAGFRWGASAARKPAAPPAPISDQT